MARADAAIVGAASKSLTIPVRSLSGLHSPNFEIVSTWSTQWFGYSAYSLESSFGGVTNGASIDGIRPSASLDLPVESGLLRATRGASRISTLGGKSPKISIKVAMLGGSAPLRSRKELVRFAVMESILPNDCERHSITYQSFAYHDLSNSLTIKRGKRVPFAGR